MTDPTDLKTGHSRLSRLVLLRQLPGVVSAADTESPALKVHENHFVHMVDPATAALRCPVDQKVLLMEISPDLYFETDDLVGQDIVLVRLDRIDDEELSLRLHDAWEFVAPDHLRKHVD